MNILLKIIELKSFNNEAVAPCFYQGTVADDAFLANVRNMAKNGRNIYPHIKKRWYP